MSKSTAPLTTASIRAFLRSPEGQATYAALSPEAKATVDKGARGRLHAEVRKVAPKAMGRRYVEGTPKTVALVVEVQRPSGKRKVTKFVPETEARALAGAVAGKRGPLSKAALATAAANYKG